MIEKEVPARECIRRGLIEAQWSVERVDDWLDDFALSVRSSERDGFWSFLSALTDDLRKAHNYAGCSPTAGEAVRRILAKVEAVRAELTSEKVA